MFYGRIDGMKVAGLLVCEIKAIGSWDDDQFYGGEEQQKEDGRWGTTNPIGPLRSGDRWHLQRVVLTDLPPVPYCFVLQQNKIGGRTKNWEPQIPKRNEIKRIKTD